MAETAVVELLRVAGFPLAERAALSGRDDRGDINGTPGLAWEVRNRRTVNLPSWLVDAQSRAVVTGADYGLLVVKPQGVGITRVENWAAVLPLADMLKLLREAGYGNPVNVP